MSVVIGLAAVIFGVLNFISILAEIFGRRRFDGSRESRVVRRRRLALNLLILAVIVGGFWAIVHFGPLRPVHEWMR
jgi:hypothetical protein